MSSQAERNQFTPGVCAGGNANAGLPALYSRNTTIGDNQTYLEQVVALIHTHFYPALIARHRPPHHRHNKLQLRLACAQAHRGRSARLQALLAWLILTTDSEPRSSRRTQDRAWNPHQPEIRAVQPQYQRYWAAGRVLPNPNPSRGGLSLQQQQSPALYLPLPPYRSQPSQLKPITRRNWPVPRAAPYFTRRRS